MRDLRESILDGEAEKLSNVSDVALLRAAFIELINDMRNYEYSSFMKIFFPYLRSPRKNQLSIYGSGESGNPREAVRAEVDRGSAVAVMSFEVTGEGVDQSITLSIHEGDPMLKSGAMNKIANLVAPFITRKYSNRGFQIFELSL